MLENELQCFANNDGGLAKEAGQQLQATWRIDEYFEGLSFQS